MLDDVASGAVAYLSTFSDVLALLGSVPVAGGDPNSGRPYIFKDDLLATLEGTSQAALVCSDYGGWGAPLPLATPRFVRLSVELFVDPARDSAHNINESQGLTRQRGKALFAQVNYHLHRTAADAVSWGDLRTVGCELLTEPQFLRADDGDGLQHGQAFYGVLVFGSADSPGA